MSSSEPIKSNLLANILNLEHGFYPAQVTPPSPLGRAHQVHGIEIKEFMPSDSYASLSDTLSLTKADAVVTEANDLWVGVQTADCIPILIGGVAKNICVAVHAGWRGVLDGIIPQTVEFLEKKGFRSKDFFYALGPSIGPCCFEVGKDLIEKFEDKWGWAWAGSFKQKPWDQGRSRFLTADQLNGPTSTVAKITGSDHWLDLKAVAKLQLINLGVPEPAIDPIPICTYCGALRMEGQEFKSETNDFASYRRSTHIGQSAGRQWSVIRFAKPTPQP